MRFSVRYRLEAEKDIQDVLDWFLENDLAYLVEQFLRRIAAAEVHLNRNPLIYQKVKHDIRSVHLTPFRQSLYFRVVDTTVVVLACQHQSREPLTVEQVLGQRHGGYGG